MATNSKIRQRRAATKASRGGSNSRRLVAAVAFSLTAAPLAPLGFVLVAGIAGLGGCAPQSGAVAEAGIHQPPSKNGYGLPKRMASADSPVVDCELPPRIHRLGIDLTYLGAQRQIRTTPRDCAIRGGDFAAPDTASRA